MDQRCCRFCRKQFELSRFHPEQTVCSNKACQQQRRSRSRQKKLALDPEYREVCRDSARMWRAHHAGYWKQYRAAAPGAMARNLIQQRLRDLRRRLANLANNNSASAQVFILQGSLRKPPSGRHLANNIPLVCRPP
jgi:hypothetical protein